MLRSLAYSIWSYPLKVINQALREITDLVRVGLSSQTLKGRFVGGTSATFAMNICFKGLLFLTSLVLARALGSSGLGAYSFALAITMVLGIGAQLGISRLLIRNVAAYQKTSSWGLLKGLLKWAHLTSLLVSTAVALVAALVIWAARSRVDPQYLFPMLIALLLLPLTAVTRIKSQALVGLQQFVRGQWPELLLHPILFLLLLGICVAFFAGSLNASLAVGLNVLALVIVLLVLSYLLHQNIPSSAKRAAPEYIQRIWLGSALSIMFVGAMHVLNSRTDILMLGLLSTPDNVGLYQVATSAAELVLLLLMPVHVTLSPIIASCFAARDFSKLQKIVTKTTRMVCLLSLPIAVGLVVFRLPLLSIFGPEYTASQSALSVLVAGHYFSILLGPVSMLLVMTKHERAAAIAVGSCVVLNVILNVILIPIWGASGAAIATASSKVLATAVMAIWVFAKLNIHPTIIVPHRT